MPHLLSKRCPRCRTGQLFRDWASDECSCLACGWTGYADAGEREKHRYERGPRLRGNDPERRGTRTAVGKTAASKLR